MVIFMNSELERLVFLSDLRDEKRRLEYYRIKYLIIIVKCLD